jgi:hypothetical protein
VAGKPAGLQALISAREPDGSLAMGWAGREPSGNERSGEPSGEEGMPGEPSGNGVCPDLKATGANILSLLFRLLDLAVPWSKPGPEWPSVRASRHCGKPAGVVNVGGPSGSEMSAPVRCEVRADQPTSSTKTAVQVGESLSAWLYLTAGLPFFSSPVLGSPWRSARTAGNGLAILGAAGLPGLTVGGPSGNE